MGFVEVVEKIVDISVFFTVLVLVIYITKYFYYDFSIFFFINPIFGSDSIFLSSPLNAVIYAGLNFLVVFLFFPFLFILGWYIYFFVHYYVIKEILLKQQALFLFFPIFELILSIPPFPQLEKFGVFRLFQGTIDAFGLHDAIKTPAKIYLVNFIFSAENIKFIFNNIFPGLGDKITKIMEEQSPTAQLAKSQVEEKPPEKEIKQILEDDPKEIARKKIDEDINACITNGTIQITPDMTDGQKNDIYRMNAEIQIKCNANKIGDYIKINMDTSQPSQSN